MRSSEVIRCSCTQITKMWKISSLLCAFMAISNALESNSSHLQSKIKKIPSAYDPYIHTLGEFEYQQVVFTADKIEGQYVKKCLGYMLSEWHGITSALCPDPKYVCTGKIGDYSSDKVYKVKRIIRLDEYIKENMTGVYLSDYPSEIVIMVLEREIQSLKTLYLQPVYNWDLWINDPLQLVTFYGDSRRMFHVSVQFLPSPKNDIFGVTFPKQDFYFKNDVGAAVFSCRHFVGIVTFHSRGILKECSRAEGVKFSHYQSIIEGIDLFRKSNCNSFLYNSLNFFKLM